MNFCVPQFSFRLLVTALQTLKTIVGPSKVRRRKQVLIVTRGPLMPLLLAGASLSLGGTYTLLIERSYPESLILKGWISGTSLQATVIYYFNRWLFKNATAILVPDLDFQELLKRKSLGLDVPVLIAADRVAPFGRRRTNE